MRYRFEWTPTGFSWFYIELKIQSLAPILYGISFKAWLSGSAGHQERRIINGFQAACPNLESGGLFPRAMPPMYAIALEL